jgi:hypothetical protein
MKQKDLAFRRDVSARLCSKVIALTGALLGLLFGPLAFAYTADFLGGTAAGWTAQTGTWAVSGGTYNSSGNGASDTTIYGTESWSTGFTFETVLRNQYNHSGNRVGVIYNYQDANNYYEVEFGGSDSPPAIATLRKVVGGVETTSTAPFTGGGLNVWFTVQVVRAGTATTVKVNGTSIFSNVSQPELGAGKIGLVTHWAQAQFSSVSVTDQEAPSAPASLSGSAASSSQINLSWAAASDNHGVVGYLLERCQGASCSNFAQIAAPVTTSHSVTGLAASTTYRFRVRAKDAANLSGAYSAIATVATSASGGGAGVTYSESFASAPSGWTVLSGTWAASGGAYVSTAGTASDIALYNGATWATDFTYEARLMNQYNHSGNRVALIYNYIDASNYYEIAFGGNDDPPAQATLKKVVAGVVTTSVANFSGGGLGVWFTTQIVRTGSTTTIKVNGTNVFTGVTQGEHGAGKIGVSTQWALGQFDDLSITVQDNSGPSAPASISATAISAQQINLTWAAATDNVAVTGYRVERCAGVGCSAFAQVAAPATTSFSDTGLAAATVYSYRVRGVDAASNLGAYSAVATATTQPGSGGSAYSQDFSSNASGWSTVSGTWGLASGVYGSTAGAVDTAIATYQGATWHTGFTLSARLRNQYNDDGNRVGLVFNYVDANNYYEVDFGGDDNPPATARLRKKVAGTFTTVATNSFTGGGINTWFTVAVIRSGTGTSVTVNGAAIFSNVTLAELGAGQIGFLTHWALGSFDDVSVTTGGGGVSGSLRFPLLATTPIGMSPRDYCAAGAVDYFKFHDVILENVWDGWMSSLCSGNDQAAHVQAIKNGSPLAVKPLVYMYTEPHFLQSCSAGGVENEAWVAIGAANWWLRSQHPNGDHVMSFWNPCYPMINLSSTNTNAAGLTVNQWLVRYFSCYTFEPNGFCDGGNSGGAYDGIVQDDLLYHPGTSPNADFNADFDRNGSEDAGGQGWVWTLFKQGQKNYHEAWRAYRPGVLTGANVSQAGHELSAGQYSEFQGYLDFCLMESVFGVTNAYEYWGGTAGAIAAVDRERALCKSSGIAAVGYNGLRVTDGIDNLDSTPWRAAEQGAIFSWIMDSAFNPQWVYNAGDYGANEHLHQWLDIYAVGANGQAQQYPNGITAAGRKWLGQAVGPRTTIQPGLLRREFEFGVCYHNARGNGTKTITASDIPGGFGTHRRVSSSQRPSWNNGQTVNANVSIAERDGICLQKL